MAFLDDFDKKITSWGRSAVQKTRDMSDSAKVSMQIKNMENRKMELYAELGRSFYELHRNVATEREEQLIGNISAMEAEIKQFQEQLRRSRGVVICGNCGAEIPSNSRFCNVCGKEINQESFSPVRQMGAGRMTDSKKENFVSVNEKKCPNCGAVLEEDQVFCVECGASVSEPNQSGEETPEQIIQEPDIQIEESCQDTEGLNQEKLSLKTEGRKCPNCGTFLEDDQLFCIQCGTKIS